MEHRVSISDLPLLIWSRILSILINNGNSSSFNVAMLKQIFRCKITCKKLNQLLDDEYWLATVMNIKSKHFRKYLMQGRLESIIKSNNTAKLEQFRALANKDKKEHGFLYYRLAPLLPLAIQHADLPLLTAFKQIPSWFYSNNDIFFKSLEVAYQREDTEKIIFLLELYGQIFCNDAQSRVALIVDALKDRKRFDLSAPHKMIEFLLIQFDETTMTEKINQLFGERVHRKQAVIIPEGELPNLEKISQKKSFLHSTTSFSIQSKKGNSNNPVSLIYREKNGTMHEIDIATKTDQSDDNKTITYCYEGVETTNINELLLRTSLAERMFSSYPHQLIAVTKQLAALPYEQQPWFKGILTEPARLTLASNAPNNSIFFTYSSENEVWLSFTTATASRKLPHKVKLRDSDSILDYLPKERFMLGLYNGGEIFGLAEHLVRRAVHKGNFNLVKQLIAEYNLDPKTNAYFDKPDNMLLLYLRLQKKENINNDMMKWLIEKGTPLAKNRFYAVVITCNDDVIKATAGTGYHIDMYSIKTLMERGCRYDTLTACWNTYLDTNQSPNALDNHFFAALEQNKFKKTTYNIRTLIMMAWKYDEHCLLRQLPKEIVLEILSYDYIDEPPYWDVLHMLIEHPKFARFFSTARPEYFATVFPLVWKNWDLKSYQPVKMHMCRIMLYSFNDQTNPSKLKADLQLFFEFLQRMPDLEPNFEEWHSSALVKYCLLTPSPVALQMVKLLLEKNLASAQTLQKVDRLVWDSLDTSTYVYGPPIFLPFVNENKPMIELLLDRGLLVSQVSHGQIKYTIQDFLKQYHPSKLYLLKYVKDCIAQRNVNKK